MKVNLWYKLVNRKNDKPLPPDEWRFIYSHYDHDEQPEQKPRQTHDSQSGWRNHDWIHFDAQFCNGKIICNEQAINLSIEKALSDLRFMEMMKLLN